MRGRVRPVAPKAPNGGLRAVAVVATALATGAGVREARAEGHPGGEVGGDVGDDANRDASDDVDRDVDEVTVRGTNTAAGFVSRASVDDSPREITDAASLIEPMPGVHVRRLGSDDSFATLSVRGSSSSQVAVYLAGVPLSGGADPTLDLATLPLWPGANARVYRSFAPASLGRGSLGGTLVLDPPSPRAPRRTEIWTALGSYGSRRLRIGDVRGEPDGTRVATGFSASRSDDDFTYLDPTASSTHDVYATRKNAGHAAVSGLAAIALPVHIGGSTGALTVTTLAQARKQQIPGSVVAPTPSQRLDSTRLLSALELTVPAFGGTFGVRAWGRREGLATRMSPEDAQYIQSPLATNDVIVATGTSVGWKWRPNAGTSIETRVDGSLERYAPGTWIGGTSAPGAGRSNLGLAFDGATGLGAGFRLASSARADLWFDHGGTEGESTDARPTGNLGLEKELGSVVVATHGGVLARPPSFVERFGNRGLFIGDPTLRPESAATVDLGARTEQRLGKLRVSFELAGFATWADDLITYVATGAYGRQRATNLGQARMLGLEAMVRAKLDGFEARVSETALASANLSACRYVGTACERPPLPGRPAQDVVADLSYGRSFWRLRYGFDFVSGIATDLTGTPALFVPPRALHSVGVRLAIPPVSGLTVAFDVRNLLDLRVATYDAALGSYRAPIGDAYAYPLPGRRFLLAITYVPPDTAARRP